MSKNQQWKREAAARRRLTIGISSVVGVILLVGLWGYFGPWPAGNNITVWGPLQIGPARTAETVRGINKWVETYGGCELPLSVSSMEAVKVDGAGLGIEEAGRGWVKISPLGSAYESGLHAGTHVCGGQEVNLLDEPIVLESFSNDPTLIGFDGARFILNDPKLGRRVVSSAEEGIAEWLALQADPLGFTLTNSADYRKYEAAAAKYFGHFDPGIIAQMVENSDGFGLIRLAMNLPEGTTPTEIQISQYIFSFK